MSNVDFIPLKQEDIEEMYEDMTNLYLKYYDRYASPDIYPARIKASVALGLLNAIEDLNDTLLKNEFQNIIKRLFEDDDE